MLLLMEQDIAEAEITPDDVQRRFGERVRTAREARGLTQVQVVDELKRYGIAMHSYTLAKLESGTRPTSVPELAGLAAVLKVEVEQLVPLTSTDSTQEFEQARHAAWIAEQRFEATRQALDAAVAAHHSAKQELESAQQAFWSLGHERLAQLARGD